MTRNPGLSCDGPRAAPTRPWHPHDVPCFPGYGMCVSRIEGTIFKKLLTPVSLKNYHSIKRDQGDYHEFTAKINTKIRAGPGG